MVFGDVHTLPGQNNNRAAWLSKLIIDVKPDVVINLGDQADMSSLCSYDKGKAAFVGRNYNADVNISKDFSDRLWSPVKKRKQKMPRRVFTIGNHEERIARALSYQPELINTIGYRDLGLEEYYDDIVDYAGNTPGTIDCDGISYSHFFVAGISGRPSSGSNPASLALSKSFKSITQGHSHVLDYCTKPTLGGGRLHSLVAGCFNDQQLAWAGQANEVWFRGCFIKRNVDKGNYDLEVISMERLKKEYAT